MRGSESSHLVRKVLALRDPRERERTHLYFAEGVRAFLAATEAGTVEQLIVSRKLLTSSLARRGVRALADSGVPVASVTPEVFRRVSQTPRASGVAMVLRQHWRPLARASPGRLWLAARHIRSPGNLGTMLRTSAAVGGAGLICLGSVDPFDPATIRGSMGVGLGQCFVRTELDAMCRWASRNRIPIVAACPNGALALPDLEPMPRAIVLVGEERRGLTEQERRAADIRVRIPMVPGVDSLNVAVATALVLYRLFEHDPEQSVRPPDSRVD